MHRSLIQHPLPVFAALLALGTTPLACGGAERGPDPRRLSVAQCEEQAARHEREAQAHEALYDPAPRDRHGDDYQCIDQPLAGIPHSGGEPLEVMRPCFTGERNPSAYHLREADRHRREAARYRAQSRALLAAERDACAGLGKDEIAHGPFFHHEDILRVEPYLESGELRGAWIVFREVEGLDVRWLASSVSCQQARAAVMGYSRTFVPASPLTAGPAATSVRQGRDGVVVTIRTERPELAAAILGRAQDLLREPEDPDPDGER